MNDYHPPGELDEEPANGQPIGLTRGELSRVIDIPYSDQPQHRLSLTWAEGVLRELYEHHRKVFGDALRAYATGDRPGTPGRKPAGGAR